jgi:hypothetical protein
MGKLANNISCRDVFIEFKCKSDRRRKLYIAYWTMNTSILSTTLVEEAHKLVH